MRTSRALTLVGCAVLAVGLAAVPVGAGPIEPDPTTTTTTTPPATDPPTTTTAPPDTTLPPDTTTPPTTSTPETLQPESLDVVPEATPPNPRKPNPMSTPDTGIGVRPGQPRVLLIGNSIMNQIGPKVTTFFANREPGVPTMRESVGGSSLFSKNQYRLGHTHVKVNDPGSGTTFNWLLRAQQLVNSFNPSITVVEFGYNYKTPFPKDKNGNVIQVGTAAFVRMAKQQAKALTNILRSRGGQVLFVSPLPLNNATAGPIMNGSWAGFEQARARKHFGVLWSGNALDGNGGAYTAQMTACTGGVRTVRDSDGLHLSTGASPNGVDLMGEATYRGIANIYGFTKPPATYFC